MLMEHRKGSAMARAIEAAAEALNDEDLDPDWFVGCHCRDYELDVALAARIAVEAAAPLLWQVGESFTLIPTALYKQLVGEAVGE